MNKEKQLVKRPKKWILKPTKFLQPEEARRMLKTAEDAKLVAEAKGIKAPVKAWMMVDLVFNSGLRVAEVCDLRCGDLFVGHGQSAVFVRDGKGGKQRSVEVNQALKRHLREFLTRKERAGEAVGKDDHLLLSNRDKAFHKSSLQKAFKEIAARAGLPEYYSIHCARHTFGTLLYKSSKRDLRLVQKQLGHSSVNTTTVYADVLAEDAKAAVEGMWTTELKVVLSEGK